MKIFVTGLCTLHWGRLQYGNIGNYYIIEPLFRELHRVFPKGEIYTTFQMTDEFVENEKISVLPMKWFYSWSDYDIPNAKKEFDLVVNGNIGEEATEYIKFLKDVDLVIDVSGDMWGDNAEHVGHGRFLVELYKLRVAQLLGCKTVLFAGTPGPFTDEGTLAFAKEVYEGFTLVLNREPTSNENLVKWNFYNSNTKAFACPAFLYEPMLCEEEQQIRDNILADGFNVGFTIGGFNLPIGPYDMWPRLDEQYDAYAEAIEYLINSLDANVYLISHTNGFELPPNFKLINGRDYPILNQLKEVVIKRNRIKDVSKIKLLDGPFLPRLTKQIIGKFDMMVTGRVHASVAAISQLVPTVFITYEQTWIPSTKMYGFSRLVGLEEYVCHANDSKALIANIKKCYSNIEQNRKILEESIPRVKDLARKAFDEMCKLA